MKLLNTSNDHNGEKLLSREISKVRTFVEMKYSVEQQMDQKRNKNGNQKSPKAIKIKMQHIETYEMQEK